MARPKKYKKLIRPEYDRDVFMVLHAIHRYSAREISEKCGISVGAVYKLRKGPKYGGTRYPQHLTMQRIASVAGFKYGLMQATEAEMTKTEIERIAVDPDKPVDVVPEKRLPGRPVEIPAQITESKSRKLPANIKRERVEIRV